jgi:superfamily II DNA or RNA helicase
MPVEIHVNNLKSQIVVYNALGQIVRFPSTSQNGLEVVHPVVGALENELTYYVELMIMGAMRSMPVHRFSIKTYKFDTGCISNVIKVLNTFEIEFKVVDKRIAIPPGVPISLRPGVTPRPYQAEAVAKGLKAGRGIFRLATGAGKTFIGANLLGQLNLPSVVFVHTLDLLDQFKTAVEFFLNIEVGQIGGGVVEPKHFTIVMMQTAIRAFDQKYVKYEVDPDDEYDDELAYNMQQKADIRRCIEQANVIISDECHHLSAATLQSLFKIAKNAYYRYGLTATLREDGADLLIHGVTGKVISDVSASFLIEHDPPYLVRPHIYYIKIPKPRGTGGGNYQQRYKNDIVENEMRNELIIQSTMRLVKKGHRVLVLAKHIKHLKTLTEMMDDGFTSSWPDLAGCNSKTVQWELATGQVNKTKRKEIIEAMRVNKLECLFASTIADEGLDCPPISAVILAGGGKSATKAFQRVGRALRLFETKDKAVIIDFYDQGKYFKKHAERRMELFRKEPAFLVKIQG